MNLNPEQAGKIFDLKEKFHADTVGLRKQMMVKEAELAALWETEKPDQAAIQAKQKELNALRDQMQVAGNYRFDGAFLGKPTCVFRDQVTLDGMEN